MDLKPFQCAQLLGGLKLLKLGNFLLKMIPGRPKTSVTKANIAAVKIVVEQDARLSVKDIASTLYWHIRRQCVNNSDKAFGPEKGLR